MEPGVRPAFQGGGSRLQAGEGDQIPLPRQPDLPRAADRGGECEPARCAGALIQRAAVGQGQGELHQPAPGLSLDQEGAGVLIVFHPFRAAAVGPAALGSKQGPVEAALLEAAQGDVPRGVPLRGLLPLIDEPGAVGDPQDLQLGLCVVLGNAELLQNLHGAGKGPVIGQGLALAVGDGEGAQVYVQKQGGRLGLGGIGGLDARLTARAEQQQPAQGQGEQAAGDVTGIGGLDRDGTDSFHLVGPPFYQPAV